MDTFRILLDGSEVARISGVGLEFGKRAISSTELRDDLKCIKKISSDGRTLFVLMASSQKNVTVERVNE